MSKKNILLNKTLLIPSVEIIAKFISFFIVIILAHFLSPSEYGTFNYVASLVLIISVLMDGGINSFIFNKSLKISNDWMRKLVWSYDAVLVMPEVKAATDYD